MKNKIVKLIENNAEVFENAFMMRFPTDEYVRCIDTVSREIVSWS